MQIQLGALVPHAPEAEQRLVLRLRCERGIERLFEIEEQYREESDEISISLHNWAAHIITADLDEELQDRDRFVERIQQSVQDLFENVLHDSFYPTYPLLSPLFIQKEGWEEGRYWLSEKFFLDESRVQFPAEYTIKAHDYAKAILSWIRSFSENSEAQLRAAYDVMRSNSHLRSLAMGYRATIQVAMMSDSVRAHTQRTTEETEALSAFVRTMIDERVRPVVERVQQQVAQETQDLEARMARMQLSHENDMTRLRDEISRLDQSGARVREELEREQQKTREHDREIRSLHAAINARKAEIKAIKGKAKKDKVVSFPCTIQ